MLMRTGSREQALNHQTTCISDSCTPQSLPHEKPYTETHQQKGSTSLVAQWLRLLAPNAGGPGSIPDQGTRSHVPHLRVRMPQRRPRSYMLQLSPGAAKWINNFFFSMKVSLFLTVSFFFFIYFY